MYIVDNFQMKDAVLMKMFNFNIYIYVDDRMENMKFPYRYHKENYNINQTCPQ